MDYFNVTREVDRPQIQLLDPGFSDARQQAPQGQHPLHSLAQSTVVMEEKLPPHYCDMTVAIRVDQPEQVPCNLVGRRRKTFHIDTDPTQNDRAREIKIFTAQRPHMRAFHFAWLSYCIIFFGWYAIPPMLPTIQDQLNLTSEQVSNSDVVSLVSTFFGRLIVGPLCDRYGSRIIQTVILLVGAIPVGCAGLAGGYTSLMIIRFVIGFVGSSFVVITYWTSAMFSREVIGSANAITAGWGNSGGGIAYLLIPVLYDIITYNDAVPASVGWRLVFVLPAILMIVVGVAVYFRSEDCPYGNYVDLKRRHVMANRARSDMLFGFGVVIKQPVTWILAFQYACSFGVELQVQNVLSLYYYDDFTVADCDPDTSATGCHLLTQTRAGLISSLFGLMCIFSRAAGGYLSDTLNHRTSMKGRIVAQILCFTGQAVTLYFYSQVRALGWSIFFLVLFGFFSHAAEGTTFAIVPFVCPEYTGITSGIVGAGGNLGGIAWSLLFRAVGHRAKSFEYVSFFTAAAAVAAIGVQVEGERSLWTRGDDVYFHSSG